MIRHMMVVLRFLLTAILFVVGACRADGEVVTVSMSGHNTFKFEGEIDKVVFSGGSPLRGTPILMSGNSAVALEIDEQKFNGVWGRKPLHMLVSMMGGDVKTLTLIPNDGARPATWREKSFNNAGRFSTPIQRPEDQWLQETFFAVVQGKVPEGFSVVETPEAGQMGELKAVYLAAFKNEAYVLLAARLESEKLAWITPQDLYAPGVQAVVIDGDRVGVKDAPIAYVLISGAR